MVKNIRETLKAMNIFKNKKIPPVPLSIWQKPLDFIAFGFGTGALPIAPGTFGTLIAIPFYLLVQSLSLTPYLILTIVLTIVSIWICDKVSKEIKVHDHQGMCLDEIVGFFVTMIAAPKGAAWIILGFFLFRLFDIWKPFPIRFVDQRVGGGFGIVIDDVLAGIYASVVIQLLSWVFK